MAKIKRGWRVAVLRGAFEVAPHGKIGWLSGPYPFNYFLQHVLRDIKEAHIKGSRSRRLNIAVVNSSKQVGTLEQVVQRDLGGTHWFVVAWKIDGYELHRQ